MNITLSTRDDYPMTYIDSDTLNIEGFSAFIYVDFAKSPEPKIHLVAVTISAHKEERFPSLSLGDLVTIGSSTYKVEGPSRFLDNRNIKLSPVS